MNKLNTKKDRSLRSRLRATAQYELGDFFLYNGKIDWVSMAFVAAPGAFGGILAGLMLKTEGEALVSANPLLGITITIAFMALGVLVTCVGVSLVVVVVSLTMDLLGERTPKKERIRTLRYNTKYLRRSVVGGRVPLDMNEMVTHDLHRRRTITLADDAGPYERYLWRRWQRQRERTLAALALSWSQDLTTAISQLQKARLREDSARQDTSYHDETEVAWHLAQQPTNVAVRRLLAEYVSTEQSDFNGSLLFRCGVVYTPRWVYDLAAFGERHSHFRATYPMFQPSYRNSKVVGDECVPIGNADRETVAKLYDPEGDGPFRSLEETVESARRL